MRGDFGPFHPSSCRENGKQESSALVLMLTFASQRLEKTNNRMVTFGEEEVNHIHMRFHRVTEKVNLHGDSQFHKRQNTQKATRIYDEIEISSCFVILYQNYFYPSAFITL